jgi:hypothetical protein
MIITEVFHYKVCARSAVEYIAQNVQTVNSQSLYQFAYGNDKVVSTLSFNDTSHDNIIVLLLLVCITAVRFVQQFFYDISKFWWKFFTNL